MVVFEEDLSGTGCRSVALHVIKYQQPFGATSCNGNTVDVAIGQSIQPKGILCRAFMSKGVCDDFTA